MATVSALGHLRRKKATTYGKTSRNASSWSATNFHDDDRTAHVPSSERKPIVEEIYSAQRPSAKPRPLKTKNRQWSSKDTWDVPSSEDEAELSPIKRTSPPKWVNKRKAVNLVEELDTVLTPWERKMMEMSSREGRANNEIGSYAMTSNSPSQEATEDVNQRITNSESSRAAGYSGSSVITQSVIRKEGPKLMTAAAKLQAKKSVAGNPSLVGASDKKASTKLAKRTSEYDEIQENGTSRKRPRSDKKLYKEFDLQMRDKSVSPPRGEIPTIEVSDTTEAMDIYDFPSTSEDEPAPQRRSPQPKWKLQSRTGVAKLNRYSSPRKMTSTPARLSAMLPSDTDNTETTSRNASTSPSRPSTPPRPTTTLTVGTPVTAIKAGGALTPKQAALWHQLLPGESVAPSPTMLQLDELTLNTRRSKQPSLVSCVLSKSSSDITPGHRIKLVDRLKASKPNTDDEMSEFGEEDSHTSDTDTESEILSANSKQTPDEDTVGVSQISSQGQSQSQSQSQSQGGNGSKAGLKVTYASRARSFLPEDDLEDSLMFELISDTPQRPVMQQRDVAKLNDVSQKSPFDLDDSDDEGASGRLRTIHELRAGGGNRRFMDDTGGLLEDISDHNISGRSRRRSALMDLANRLADAGFAERFFRQGYEQKLVAECGAAPDDIADFALASAFATAMSVDPPDHVSQSLKNGGVLSWLVRLLEDCSDVRGLARERRNNMSKSAQGAFTTFVEEVEGRDIVWGEMKPRVLTPRIVALKACDQLVRKLRNTGDTSELMGANGVRLLISDQSDISSIDGEAATPETVLAISTLESLSTAALSLHWPNYVMEQLHVLLTSSHLSQSDRSESKHLLFLTLRLLTNLTNGNSRNCKILSQASDVLCILRLIADGFDELYTDLDPLQRTMNLDKLVLSTGVLINLTECDEGARAHTTTTEARAVLDRLVHVFCAGQQRMLEAESEEQGVTNVVYGYLAVALANLCGHREAKAAITAQLPNHSLAVLVDALEEFVAHHERVDTQNFDGEEGASVWSAHTERLKGVVDRLRREI